jgi:16S rRNA (guanine(966)-N(2))-methyltransferase RsmD
MKISAGQYKGRKIGSRKLLSKGVGGSDVRPTSSKVREAIFDILRNEIEGAYFLDLYAGTGAVGFEALSRGAEKVFFVEADRMRAKAIRDAVSALDVAARTDIFSERAEIFLRRATRHSWSFSIVFADPPYASDEIGKILPFIAEYGILRAEGALLCEHASKAVLPGDAGNLRKVRQYTYGDTMLTLYRKMT